MFIENEFDFWQEVYLKTDPDQNKRQIIGMSVRPDGGVSYELTCGTETTWHYANEISLEKNFTVSNFTNE